MEGAGTMKDSQAFDHRPDPELGAALRAALDPKDDQKAFVARVMAQYDRALDRATVPTVDVLASWFRPGIAAAAAALIAGFLLGRTVLAPAPASFDTAMAPSEGPGLAALVTASDPSRHACVPRSTPSSRRSSGLVTSNSSIGLSINVGSGKTPPKGKQGATNAAEFGGGDVGNPSRGPRGSADAGTATAGRSHTGRGRSARARRPADDGAGTGRSAHRRRGPALGIRGVPAIAHDQRFSQPEQSALPHRHRHDDVPPGLHLLRRTDAESQSVHGISAAVGSEELVRQHRGRGRGSGQSALPSDPANQAGIL